MLNGDKRSKDKIEQEKPQDTHGIPECMCKRSFRTRQQQGREEAQRERYSSKTGTAFQYFLAGSLRWLTGSPSSGRALEWQPWRTFLRPAAKQVLREAQKPGSGHGSEKSRLEVGLT